MQLSRYWWKHHFHIANLHLGVATPQYYHNRKSHVNIFFQKYSLFFNFFCTFFEFLQTPGAGYGNYGENMALTQKKSKTKTYLGFNFLYYNSSSNRCCLRFSNSSSVIKFLSLRF